MQVLILAFLVFLTRRALQHNLVAFCCLLLLYRGNFTLYTAVIPVPIVGTLCLVLAQDKALFPWVFSYCGNTTLCGFLLWVWCLLVAGHRTL